MNITSFLKRGAVLRALFLVLLFVSSIPCIGSPESGGAELFPPPLDSYGAARHGGLWAELLHRAAAQPFNVVATLIFLLAIAHTFLASKCMHLAHVWRTTHQARIREESRVTDLPLDLDRKEPVSFKAEMMHFLGEVEAVFGIWAVPLLACFVAFKGLPAAEHYISYGVKFTEPMLVVVIMAISSTRPVLRAAEQCLSWVARLGGRTPAAWWLSILTVGPLFGSFITEPAAMTICAMVLARQFFDRNPPSTLCYATLGLLFVNISVGGTLTHFAAPPILMVATKWDWNTAFMFTHYGWKAMVGIALANGIYFLCFRRALSALGTSPKNARPAIPADRKDFVPVWITFVHLGFLGWTVFSAHYPELFIGGFLFFLAFTTATEQHQTPLNLKPPLLVGFFLSGLVVHGGLQGWWIEPILKNLGATPLLLSAASLTAFNDNAAITYLATLVPAFGDAMKYAVVAGAVAGGGLTVIANAPNPAGQSIVSKYFEDGVSPLKLFLSALLPTGVVILCFLFL